MADSSSVDEQMAQSTLLGMKANPNLISDLDPSMYDAFLQPLIDCLRYSPLATALSKIENVPLALLSRAYSSACYEEGDSAIYFELDNKKNSITKSRFSHLLGLPLTRDLIEP